MKLDFSSDRHNSSQTTRRNLWGISEIPEGPNFDNVRKGSSL